MDEAERTHFDYVVIGTGLRESLLAAALAKAGHAVLHVDERLYYGGDQATLSLKEFVSWAKSTPDAEVRFTGTESTDPPEDLARLSRDYNLSLFPTLVPAAGPFVTALVRSGVAKYAAFKLIDSVALYQDGQLKAAASTKEDIFKDRSISLVDKRKLMKFLMSANATSTEDPVFSEMTHERLADMLAQRFSLGNRLKDLVQYAACLCATSDATVGPAIERLRKYVKSNGRYGRSPFLLGQYGGLGELIQGFCRVSAVFGSTYVLGRPIKHLQPGTATEPAKITFEEGEDFTADHIISLDLAVDQATTSIHRAIVILSHPVRLSSEQPAETSENTEKPSMENLLFVFPPNSLGTSEPAQPVTAIMAGEGSFSAPPGQYVLYMASIADAKATASPKKALQPVLRRLLQTQSPEDAAGDAVLAEAYYTTKGNGPLVIEKAGERTTTEMVSDITAQLAFSELCDTAVEEASACFRALTGETELFEQMENVDDEGLDDM